MTGCGNAGDPESQKFFGVAFLQKSDRLLPSSLNPLLPILYQNKFPLGAAKITLY
jgi:hypothetical protein